MHFLVICGASYGSSGGAALCYQLNGTGFSGLMEVLPFVSAYFTLFIAAALVDSLRLIIMRSKLLSNDFSIQAICIISVKILSIEKTVLRRMYAMNIENKTKKNTTKIR